MNSDRVYAQPLTVIEDFRFDAAVADVFENMISRSVPGYSVILDLIGLVAEVYGQPGSRCYDLGCSLGAATQRVRRRLPDSCTVIGVDSSADMIERCRTNVDRDNMTLQNRGAAVEIRHEDLRDTTIEDASIVVMNFTLQFIPPHERSTVLARIAAGMRPGGALVLSEKIRFEDSQTQQFMTDLHHEFKRTQGYSALEIAQKRTALENVMVTETEQAHIARLHAAGFHDARAMSRCINFASFIAFR